MGPRHRRHRCVTVIAVLVLLVTLPVIAVVRIVHCVLLNSAFFRFKDDNDAAAGSERRVGSAYAQVLFLWPALPLAATKVSGVRGRNLAPVLCSFYEQTSVV